MLLIKKIIFILITLSALSCGLHIGESSQTPNTEGFSVGCLNGIGEKAGLYLKGQLSDKAINNTANCIQEALTIFKDRVHGQTAGEFTLNELRRFIHDLFLQDNIIRDKLLNQLARLKTVIIGGAENKLTIQDIDAFISFVDILKKEAVFFRPYFQAFYILNQNHKEGDISQLKSIERDLKKSISRVSVFFKSFANPYNLQDMEALFQELDFFSDHHHNIANLKEKINLLGAIKSFVFGQSDSFIKPNQWNAFLTAFAYLISAHVNWTVLKKQNQWLVPQGATTLASLFNDLTLFLSLTLQNRPNRPVEIQDLLNLSQHLQQASFIPKKIQEPGLKSLWGVLFGKVWTPQNQFDFQITAGHIKTMRQFSQLWTATQSALDYTYHSQDLTPLPIKARAFFPSADLWTRGEIILNDIFSMKALYKQGKKIYISTNIHNQKKSLDYKNIKMYSFYRFIAEIINMGYKKSPPDVPGLSQQELKSFFTDFRPFAVNMNWLSRRQKTAVMMEGEAEFIAANMLTAGAKGFNTSWEKPEYLTSNEVVEYIAYAFSFGIQLAEIGPPLFKICAEDTAPPPSPVAEHLKWKNSRYNKDCVRLHLMPLLKQHTKNLPHFQKSLENKSEEEIKSLTEALIHISYETEEQYQYSNYMHTEHIKNIIMALYFVETTITRYDKDKNLTLDHEEIKLAFPTFKGYLARILINLLCEPSDNFVMDYYSYVIEKGTLPSSNTLSVWDKTRAFSEIRLQNLWRRNGYDYWELSLDRTKLTRIFSALVKGLLHKKKTNTNQTCAPLVAPPLNELPGPYAP